MEGKDFSSVIHKNKRAGFCYNMGRMNKRTDNEKLIRDLEEEFSDEKMAEIFRDPKSETFHVSGRQGRLTGRAIVPRIVILIVVALLVVVAFQFFSFRVVHENSMAGLLMERDCIVISKMAYNSADVAAGDVVAYYSDEESGRIEFGRYGADDAGLDISEEAIYGKVVFRVFPISRAGNLK